MKLKKIFAAVAATAVAISAMAVNAFALATTDYVEISEGKGTIFLVADDGKPQWAVDAGVDVTTVYGVKFNVSFDSGEVANDSVWIGGGIGANSPSTGWEQHEWGRSGKEVTCDLTNGTITWMDTEPVFKADDKNVQFWLQTWGGKVTVNSIDVLDKDGNVIVGNEPAPAEEEAATDEAAPEETAEEADEATADAADAAVEAPADEEAGGSDVAVDDTDEVVEEDGADVVEEAPAADTTTDAAATGNVAVASIAAVMAIAGAAAVATKKRK